MKKILVTGASGYCGLNVSKLLKEKNYEVIGVCRNEEGANKLKNIGVTPLMGDIREPKNIIDAAKEADAVLHLAFIHDFTQMDASIEYDKTFIKGLIDALQGTNKPLIVTSGTAVVTLVAPGTTVNDDTNPLTTELHRGNAELMVLKAQGIRGSSIRLPPFVYGQGGKGFVALMLTVAKSRGEANYIEGSNNRVGVVHVEDVARLYVAALEKGKAGAVYNGSAVNVEFKELAEAVSKNLGVSLKGVSFEEATKIWGPFLATIFSKNIVSTATRAQSDLGWKHTSTIGVIQDVTSGSYKQIDWSKTH